MANVLVFNAIRLVGPSRVTVSQFLVPACAVVLGAVFLAEPVGIAQVAGGAVIVLGVWLTRRPVLLPTAMRARMARSTAADLTSSGLEAPNGGGRLSPRKGLPHIRPTVPALQRDDSSLRRSTGRFEPALRIHLDAGLALLRARRPTIPGRTRRRQIQCTTRGRTLRHDRLASSSRQDSVEELIRRAAGRDTAAFARIAASTTRG